MSTTCIYYWPCTFHRFISGFLQDHAQSQHPLLEGDESLVVAPMFAQILLNEVQDTEEVSFLVVFNRAQQINLWGRRGEWCEPCFLYKVCIQEFLGVSYALFYDPQTSLCCNVRIVSCYESLTSLSLGINRAGEDAGEKQEKKKEKWKRK